MPFFRKLQTLRALDSETRRFALQSIVLSTLLEAGFRFLGVSSTQRHLHRWAAQTLASSHDPAPCLRPAKLAASIARRNSPTACLSASMALWALLLRRGISSELRVGFRRQDDRMEGHCWVEYQGTPLNEKPDVAVTYAVADQSARFDLWQRHGRVLH
jgi:hypothetical protein